MFDLIYKVYQKKFLLQKKMSSLSKTTNLTSNKQGSWAYYGKQNDKRP